MLWGPRTLRVGGSSSLSHQRSVPAPPADQQCNGPLHSARGLPEPPPPALVGKPMRLAAAACGGGGGGRRAWPLQPLQQGIPPPTPPTAEETEDLGN